MEKLKIAGIAAGLLLAASLGTAVYSAVSMESLSRQNQLYQNQLKMAEEKMKSLEDKTATIEKLSDQLQDMVKANSNGAAQNMTGGIGGASTVPDKAKTAAVKEQGESTSYATPGSLLRSMRQLDARLDAQIKTMIVLREQVMNQTYGMQTTLLSASSATPDIWPVKGQVSSSYGFRASPGGHRLHLPRRPRYCCRLRRACLSDGLRYSHPRRLGGRLWLSRRGEARW